MRLTVPDAGSIAGEASLVALTVTDANPFLGSARVDPFAGNDDRSVAGPLGSNSAILPRELLP